MMRENVETEHIIRQKKNSETQAAIDRKGRIGKTRGTES